MTLALGSSKVQIYVNAPLAETLDLSTAQDPLAIQSQKAISNGVGANQANRTWHDRRTLTQAGPGNVDSLDLVGTALQDAFGNNVALARIKALYVKNNSAASTLKIGGNVTPIPLFAAANDVLVLRPGGEVLLVGFDATGYALVGGSADILDITHGGEDAADLTYDIVVIGAAT